MVIPFHILEKFHSHKYIDDDRKIYDPILMDTYVIIALKSDIYNCFQNKKIPNYSF